MIWQNEDRIHHIRVVNTTLSQTERNNRSFSNKND